MASSGRRTYGSFTLAELIVLALIAIPLFAATGWTCYSIVTASHVWLAQKNAEDTFLQVRPASAGGAFPSATKIVFLGNEYSRRKALDFHVRLGDQHQASSIDGKTVLVDPAKTTDTAVVFYVKSSSNVYEMYAHLVPGAANQTKPSFIRLH